MYTRNAAIASQLSNLFSEYNADMRRALAVARLRQDQHTVADIAYIEDQLHHMVRHDAERANMARIYLTALKEI